MQLLIRKFTFCRIKVFIVDAHTKMKSLSPFVMWDENRLQIQVWHYHGLHPVCNWVQLKQRTTLLLHQMFL